MYQGIKFVNSSEHFVHVSNEWFFDTFQASLVSKGKLIRDVKVSIALYHNFVG